MKNFLKKRLKIYFSVIFGDWIIDEVLRKAWDYE